MVDGVVNEEQGEIMQWIYDVVLVESGIYRIIWNQMGGRAFRERKVVAISLGGKRKGCDQREQTSEQYPFSGRIICSECGGKFKWRIYYFTYEKYIA